MARRIQTVAWVVAALGAAAAFWLYLAPTQLGGRTSYVVVYGTSMEPHLHGGDLVLLRRRASYTVGSVVGYHSLQLRRTVLHRILAVRDGRFAFKGDNNGFVDPEHPPRSRLFGEQWIVLPGFGGALERLRSPAGVALLAGLAVLVLGIGAAPAGRRRRRVAPRRAAAAAEPPREPPPAPRRAAGRRPAAGAGLALALAGAGALAAALALGGVALGRPLRHPVVDPALYVQRGAFAYAATVPVGAVYQRPRLASADPVFLHVVHRLHVRFAYSVRSRHPSGFAGRARLDAVLGDGSGWRHVFPLARARRFAGGSASVGGTLDLDAVLAAVRRFERLTGEHDTLYRLQLVPEVRMRGVVDGRPVADTFAPALDFDLDQLRLQLARPADGSDANGLVRTRAAAGTGAAPTTVALAGRTIEVGRARRLALEAGAGGLVALLLGGALFAAGRRGGELAAIERRYGDLIVPVAGGAPAGPERLVASMDALVRIAERYERLVLHERRADRDVFLVEEGGLVFRHDVLDDDPGYRVELPAEEPTAELRPGLPRTRAAREDA